MLTEVDENLRLVELNIDSFRKTSLALDADIAMLRAKQSSNAPVAMKLDYTWHPNDSAFGARMEVAGAISRRAPDGNLQVREIEELMSATSEAQGRLTLLIRLLRYAKSDLEDVRAP